MKLNQLGVGTVVVLAFLLAIINLVFSFMFSRMVTPEEENPSVEPQFLSMKSRFMHLMFVQSQVMDVFLLWTVLVTAGAIIGYKMITAAPKNNMNFIRNM